MLTKGDKYMAKKNLLITDDGTYVNKKDTHSMIFVTLCRILTVGLIVLGVIAFVTGNM